MSPPSPPSSSSGLCVCPLTCHWLALALAAQEAHGVEDLSHRRRRVGSLDGRGVLQKQHQTQHNTHTHNRAVRAQKGQHRPPQHQWCRSIAQSISCTPHVVSHVPRTLVHSPLLLLCAASCAFSSSSMNGLCLELGPVLSRT